MRNTNPGRRAACLLASMLLIESPRARADERPTLHGTITDAITSRPVSVAVVRAGATSELAKKATTTPIVIATRPKDAPAGAMASLILQVPSLDKAIEAAKAAGATLLRAPGKTETVNFAFLKDPDGNQIELVMNQK